MMYFETSFPIRYYETDQMGIVHHSNYIRFFECARNGMMADGGYPIEQCEADGVTIPIVSVQCRYKHPAKMVIRQEVRNQDGVVCASGEVMLGFLDKETGHPVRCPEKLARLIESRLNDR